MILQNKFIFKQILKDFKKNLDKNSLERKANQLYSEELIKTDFNKLVCHNCNTVGDYEIKGYYKRTIILNHIPIRIRICRIKCRKCNRTHAILFMDFIPYYSMNSIESRMLILSNYKDTLYDYDVIKRLKKRVTIFALRIKSLLLYIKDEIKVINEHFIKKRRNSYLQIHRGIVLREESS